MKADISAAPYTTKRGPAGTMSQTRVHDLILLVGLTELKVQIAWIDSTTVSSHGAYLVHHLSDFREVWDPGVGEKV